MLLTITNTAAPATDLGFLLHKNPARVHTVDLTFGKAHVFYPEATESRCTVALMLDVDPVGMVRRGPHKQPEGVWSRYVNDRPYVASSFLSVALGKAFRTAMSGRSRERAELVNTALPLEIRLSAVPCRGGAGLLRELFEPLGYTMDISRLPLDAAFPEWGESPYYTVTLLSSTVTVQQLLNHLFVLIPVMDNDKHYWVGEDEVEKLLDKGKDWLSEHPKREFIAKRYLKHRGYLAQRALEQLTQDDPAPQAEDEAEETLEKPVRLNDLRMEAVEQVLMAIQPKTVLDLGCGEGRLIRRLLKQKTLTQVTGIDVSPAVLELAETRLRLDCMAERQRERVSVLHGSLAYRDDRMRGFDAAAVVEVIEHLDPPRLAAFEQTVFGHARPGRVVLTTPNIEYNVRFETLAAGKLRHRDHRFEWTRAEFQDWAEHVAAAHTYTVTIQGIGEEDPEVGTPTQMAVFDREEQ